MNSNDRLPFIIFLTRISCDGSNRLWCRRLLPSPYSLWRHKQTLVGVIRPLAGGKCRRFRRATEWYRFHRYLCFHYIFCVRVFCILFCTNRVTLSYQNCIHSNSTLNTKIVTYEWTRDSNNRFPGLSTLHKILFFKPLSHFSYEFCVLPKLF